MSTVQINMQLTWAIDPGSDSTPICGKMYAMSLDKGWSLKDPRVDAGRTIECKCIVSAPNAHIGSALNVHAGPCWLMVDVMT